MASCQDQDYQTSQMEEEKFLTQLPEEIIRHIGSFLSYQDVTRLSITCHRMKAILPRFIILKGSTIDQEGPRDGHWTPEKYFDTTKFASRVKKITISMKWRDQGFLNQKGRIWFQLWRPISSDNEEGLYNTKGSKSFSLKKLLKGDFSKPDVVKMIAEDLNIFDLAPHREESVSKVLTSNESILNKVLPGDYIRFMKNVGGGGGHHLYVKDFSVIIEMFSE